MTAICDFTAVRTCKACRQQKVSSEFNKNKTKPGGFSTECRQCCVAYRKQYRADNKDKLKANDAAHYASNSRRIKGTVSAYRKANSAKLNLTVSAYYGAHKVEIAKYQAAYRAAYKNENPEKYAASKAAWAKANPEALRIKAHTRRARLTSGGSLSKGLIPKLMGLQRGMCPCCGIALGEKYHLDHKMPLALGGANIDSNMQLLRATCNMQKSAKHPVDFMQSRGFLL